MKSNTILRLTVLLAAVLILALLAYAVGSATSSTPETPETTVADSSSESSTSAALPDIWEAATHKEDASFGEGSKTFSLKVIADGYSVVFTIHTDEDKVGPALLAHGLIAGEEGPYGLYVKTVNGMLADYDVDQTYWSFSKNGEALMTGVDQTTIESGAQYELTKAK